MGINAFIDYGINSKINVFFNEIILYFKDIGNTYYVLNVLIKELESKGTK